MKALLIFFLTIEALIGFESFGIASGAAQTENIGVKTLGAIQCIDQETRDHTHLSPTGCVAPSPECRVNFHKSNPQRACRSAARRRSCQDFTWEKCCFVTCNQVTADKNLVFGPKDLCMGICMSAPEADIYTPNAAFKK